MILPLNHYHSKWHSTSVNILLQNFQQLHYIFSKFQRWYYCTPNMYTSWMRNEPNVHVIEPYSKMACVSLSSRMHSCQNYSYCHGLRDSMVNSYHNWSKIITTSTIICIWVHVPVAILMLSTSSTLNCPYFRKTL